ncbi:MAG: glutamine--fructose-6-phosphate transaminase (isomerizing) [Proteobacteria bacterium]|nr:glutamine--fructose-6-phosphate transaminase (isomerizing) [Pseudomonadota bacterium]
MCGIVGYTGNKYAVPIIIDGLKRLEYRGYDSAGVAVHERNAIKIVRAVGKLRNLIEKTANLKASGTSGIGHTRWATHGKPSEVNAHPHKAGSIVLVHNGIIENYGELKARLIKKGVIFESETDTEVIAQLINFYFQETKDLFSAIIRSIKDLRGSFACAVLNEKEPDKIYLMKYESPLVIGLGDRENFFASDMPALLPYTNRIVFLKDGEIAVLTDKTYKIFDFSGNEVKREPEIMNISISQAEKGGYPHFMLKEIFEQPEAFINTVRTRLHPDKGEIVLDELNYKISERFSSIHIVACGTSYHAGLLGRIFLEELAEMPVYVEIASEFRYKKNFFNKDTLYLFISQSGSTADTLAALKKCKEAGMGTLAICNVLGSSISLEADNTIYTHAGPEIGVASTKAFSTQVSVLLLLALKIAGEKNLLKRKEIKKYINDMLSLPRLMEEALKSSENIKDIAKKFHKYTNFLYLGRGLSYPLAMEGALKLKEISYIHAEAYAAGEMKHGPIALIDENMPTFLINPESPHFEKTLSNMQEVLARGGKIIALASNNDSTTKNYTDYIIYIPHINTYLDTLLTIIPLQLFAYYCAVLKGTDVDQPRNLAKSVTVE